MIEMIDRNICNISKLLLDKPEENYPFGAIPYLAPRESKSTYYICEALIKSKITKQDVSKTAFKEDKQFMKYWLKARLL